MVILSRNEQVLNFSLYNLFFYSSFSVFPNSFFRVKSFNVDSNVMFHFDKIEIPTFCFNEMSTNNQRNIFRNILFVGLNKVDQISFSIEYYQMFHSPNLLFITFLLDIF